jgi:hypothetical protein
MNSLSFVGIAELYALSWCVLVFKLTGNVHHTCLNHDVEGEVKSHMHITHGVPKHDEFLIPEDVVEKIDAMTSLDQRFYRASVIRFMEDVQVMQSITGVSLDHLINVNVLNRHSFYIENMWVLNKE